MDSLRRAESEKRVEIRAIAVLDDPLLAVDAVCVR